MADQSKGRAIRLIEYLAALAKINSKIVRSIEEYKSVLWVYAIPHEPKHCFCRAWGEEDEHGDDVWIEVNTSELLKITDTATGLTSLRATTQASFSVA